MTDDTYNGYANRETWAMSLWLDNDQGLYLAALETVRGAYQNWDYNNPMLDDYYDDAEHGPERVEKSRAREAAEALEEYVKDMFDPENMRHAGKTMWSMREDVGSLWRIDWAEVTQGFIDVMKEEDEANEA